MEESFILVFTISGCFLISAFALLVGIPISTSSSAVELKNCAELKRKS